jgi:argininosuccinate synthase
MDRIVLAYTGGLETSVAIRWLAERQRAEVVTVTLDLGQDRELDEARDRALAIGAVRAHVLDARETFARDFVLPALQAGAVYEEHGLLSTALGRPLIARQLVEMARIEGAAAIAHGCAGGGDDRVRLEVSARALDPGLRVLSPVRDWSFTRADLAEYARERGIPLPADVETPHAVDSNLWGRSIDCGPSDDGWREVPDEVYLLTKAAAGAPDEPAYVELEFVKGVPIRINGVEMALVELIQSLETIAGAHGIGRADPMENRLLGIKSHQVYEAPAAVALHLAHRDLQRFVSSRDLDRLTADLSVAYADLVYNGLWYTPMREAIDALVAKVQERVAGTVRLRFFKGDCRVVGRKSPHGLYDPALAVDEAVGAASEGFGRIWGLPLETAARRPRATPRTGTKAGRK